VLRSVALVGCLATALCGQQSKTDLLRLVQARISDSLDRLPRYMCTLTIDRKEFQRDVRSPRSSACDGEQDQAKAHLVTSDRLRLDVAKTAGGEMYSWVGENHFNDQDLLSLVRDGAISDGSFVGFLNNIFRTGEASFIFNRDTTWSGRIASDFGFKVPLERGKYSFSDGRQRITVGYQGTFLVDPETGDLLRLTIRTDPLFPQTTDCYLSTELDYRRVAVANTDALLPTESLLTVFSSDGTEAENHTKFSNCHVFLADSTVSFDPPSNVPGPEKGRVTGSQALVIPSRVRFRVALAQGIDTATAAAGDGIKGRLITPIQAGRKLLIPAGASIGGRIVEVRQLDGAASYIRFRFKLETVDVGDISIPLEATPDNGDAGHKARVGGFRQRSVEIGTLKALRDRSVEFVFRSDHQPYLIGNGLTSSWITAAPRAPDSARTPIK
jgi:hypothetical protein